MLVDLGRNDVGKVAQMGSVSVDRLMEVEKYSHVMHISSTVTGKLLPELNAWDVMRAALPAGTVSGAPKVTCVRITAITYVSVVSSLVMHVSSTVTGKLLPELNAWDVMRAALPAGTVIGAPKVTCVHTNCTCEPDCLLPSFSSPQP